MRFHILTLTIILSRSFTLFKNYYKKIHHRSINPETPTIKPNLLSHKQPSTSSLVCTRPTQVFTHKSLATLLQHTSNSQYKTSDHRNSNRASESSARTVFGAVRVGRRRRRDASRLPWVGVVGRRRRTISHTKLDPNLKLRGAICSNLNWRCSR